MRRSTSVSLGPRQVASLPQSGVENLDTLHALARRTRADHSTRDSQVIDSNQFFPAVPQTGTICAFLGTGRLNAESMNLWLQRNLS